MKKDMEKYAPIARVSLGDAARRKTVRARNVETGEACRYTQEEIGALVRAGKTDNAENIRRAAFSRHQR